VGWAQKVKSPNTEERAPCSDLGCIGMWMAGARLVHAPGNGPSYLEGSPR